MAHAQENPSPPEKHDLSMEPICGKGPYAVDASSLIPFDLLLYKPKDEFSMVQHQIELKKWRRQAALLLFCPQAEEHPDPAKWDLYSLQQLRLYIAKTAPEKRCLCTRHPLNCLDDHWPDCPTAAEERIKRFEEHRKVARQWKILYCTRNLCSLLKEETEMGFIPDEEVRSLSVFFEKELKKRSL